MSGLHFAHCKVSYKDVKQDVKLIKHHAVNSTLPREMADHLGAEDWCNDLVEADNRGHLPSGW